MSDYEFKTVVIPNQHSNLMLVEEDLDEHGHQVIDFHLQPIIAWAYDQTTNNLEGETRFSPVRVLSIVNEDKEPIIWNTETGHWEEVDASLGDGRESLIEHLNFNLRRRRERQHLRELAREPEPVQEFEL